MKLSRNMLWSQPFIEAVSDLVLLERLVSVRGYTLPFGQREHQDASITRTRGRRYRIQIRLTGNFMFTRRPLILEDLLIALAHELAHTRQWRHTPEHLALTARILQRFAAVAREQGVRNTNRRLGRKEAA